MAKTVTFHAKDVLGKDFTVIDSNKNIKLVSKGMRNLLDDIDKYETKHAKENKPVTVMDYIDLTNGRVITETGKLLGLNKADTEKLEDMSYSDVYEFYSNVADKFLDMKVPNAKYFQSGIDAMNNAALGEDKDPKSKEGN